MGTNDGTSWTDAFTDLQDALDAATAAGSAITEIWVAAGQYRPDRDTGDRHATFQLQDGLGIYGGFAGRETTRNQRDWETNQTILTGDLLGDDGPGWTNTRENAFHVVTGRGVGTGTVLDGVVVSAGNTEPIDFADWDADYDGAGVYLESASPILRHCAIERNQTAARWTPDGYGPGGHGAGVYCSNGFPTFDDCTIINNRTGLGRSSGSGAGMYFVNSSPRIQGCRIIANNTGDGEAERRGPEPDSFAASAGHGAGVYLGSSLCSVTNSVIVFNQTGSGGQGTELPPDFFGDSGDGGDGGGVFVDAASSLALVNSHVAYNRTGDGGWGCWSGDPPCHIEEGRSGRGGGLFAFPGRLTVANSVVWSNVSPDTDAQVSGTFTARHSCIQHLPTYLVGGGNITSDPLFRNPEGPDGILGTSDDDFRLLPGSPCIDAGDNAAVPFGIWTDADGQQRFQDDPNTPDTGLGSPPVVDMGAFEFQSGGG